MRNSIKNHMKRLRSDFNKTVSVEDMEKILNSPEILSFLSKKTKILSKRYLENCKFIADQHGTAGTNSQYVFVNLTRTNPYLEGETNLQKIIQIVLGMIVHECAHILYTDFQTMNRLSETFHRNEFPEELKPYSTGVIEDFLKKSSVDDNLKYSLVNELFFNLSNIFEDAFIEKQVILEYPGEPRRFLGAERRKHLQAANYLEETPEKELKKNFTGNMLDFFLYFAKFRLILIKDRSKFSKTHHYFEEVFLKVKYDIVDCVNCANAKERIYKTWQIFEKVFLDIMPDEKELKALQKAMKKMSEMNKNASGNSSQQNSSSPKMNGESSSSSSSSSSSNQQKNNNSSAESSKTSGQEQSDGGQNGEESGTKNEGQNENGSSDSGKDSGENDTESNNTGGGDESANGEQSEQENTGSGNKGQEDQDTDANIEAQDGSNEESGSKGQKDSDEQNGSDGEKGSDEQNGRSSDGDGDTGEDGSREENNDVQKSIDREAEVSNEDIQTIASALKQAAKSVAESNEEELQQKAMQDYADAYFRTESAFEDRGISIKFVSADDVICDSNETASAAAKYNEVLQKNKTIINRAKNRMEPLLKKVVPNGRLKGSYIGKIDPTQFGRKDMRYWDRKILPKDKSLAVGLLIDESGSMCLGNRYQKAREAAICLYEFCKSLNIPVAIYGHTADYLRSDVVMIKYKDFEENNDVKIRNRLVKISARYNNRDSAANAVVCQALSERPEKQKLFIVISDGRPNACGYGGEKAMKVMANTKKHYAAFGVTTFAAAIGDDKKELLNCYGQDSFLDIRKLSDLPENLVRLVKNYLPM